LYFGSPFGTVTAVTMATATSTITHEGLAAPLPARRQPRRFWSHAALFAACVLLVNGVFGERGLTDTLRARKSYAASARDLARLKHENGVLRDEARRLRSDPATIESVARGELGLIRPGEILVTIKDVR
jgi:cell division protein FtsB